jgi:hypothetical protein
MVGTNFRADMIFVKSQGLFPNAYGAMKFLRCSKETSYRIWKNLEEANIEELALNRL